MRFIANKRQYISSLLFLMLCSVFLFSSCHYFNNKHEKCINLHRGVDGISKTWKEVVVNVRAVIINTSVDRIKNH